MIDPDLQYCVPGKTSTRHRVRNNLPGSKKFCPLVFHTELLESYHKADLPVRAMKVIGDVPADILTRAAAFLLMDDSRASFPIKHNSRKRSVSIPAGLSFAILSLVTIIVSAIFDSFTL